MILRQIQLLLTSDKRVKFSISMMFFLIVDTDIFLDALEVSRVMWANHKFM